MVWGQGERFLVHTFVKNTMGIRTIDKGNGHKKRMDKRWWHGISDISLFDPEPEKIDWKPLFSLNSNHTFHLDLQFADAQ
jgi:hypothetical protein